MKYKNNQDINTSDNNIQFINNIPNKYNIITDNTNNTNIPNIKLLNEDILIPIEVETYLNVNQLYFIIKFILYIVFK
jgi:hypothetical protein